MPTRNTPLEVRRQLRREVNFGCPVAGCGNPYLTYHHFDPTFEEHPHHDPKGMIALCAQHHAAADHTATSSGRFSREQLRALKSGSGSTAFVRSSIDPLDSNVLIICGGLWNICSEARVAVGNLPLFGLRRDEELGTLVDLALAHSDGKKAVIVDGGDLEAPVEMLRDLEFTLRSQQHTIELHDGARIKFGLTRPPRSGLLAEIVNGWVSDDQLRRQLLVLERYCRPKDLARIAEEAAEYQLSHFCRMAGVSDFHELQVLQIDARIPISDFAGNLAWLHLTPWTMDLELQAGCTRFSNGLGGWYESSSGRRVRGPRMNPMQSPMRSYVGPVVSVTLGRTRSGTAVSLLEEVHQRRSYLPDPVPTDARHQMLVVMAMRWPPSSVKFGGEWPTDESHPIVQAAAAFERGDYEAAFEVGQHATDDESLRLLARFMLATWAVALQHEPQAEDRAVTLVEQLLDEARSLGFPGQYGLTSQGMTVAHGLHSLRDWLSARQPGHRLGNRLDLLTAPNRRKADRQWGTS